MRRPATTTLNERLGVPFELSLTEAAEVLGVDKKTVTRYMRDGVLEWRNIAPPSSSRPTFRIKLTSVLTFRTHYNKSDPGQPQESPRKSQRRDMKRQYQSRYVKIVRREPG